MSLVRFEFHKILVINAERAVPAGNEYMGYTSPNLIPAQKCAFVFYILLRF